MLQRKLVNLCKSWQMYLVADNRVIKINLLNNGTSEPAAEVLLSAEPTKEGQGGIVGLAVSTMSSSVFVNIKNRGLFAYITRGQLLWSAGPVIDLFGYRQGCRKNIADCFFNSVPVIDECEASIYVRSAHPCFLSPFFFQNYNLGAYYNVISFSLSVLYTSLKNVYIIQESNFIWNFFVKSTIYSVITSCRSQILEGNCTRYQSAVHTSSGSRI